MKFTLNSIALFLVILLSSNSFAREKVSISCTHIELCRLYASVIKEQNTQNEVAFEHVVQISGDPHDFDPLSSDIKNLISTEHLIVGPRELNPWVTKIIEQRNKNKKRTIELNLNAESKKLYNTTNTEALSHFWLYPKVICQFKESLQAELIAHKEIQGSKTKNTQEDCLILALKKELELKSALDKLKFPLVLTHDALMPLFLSLKPDLKITAIKGSGHHHEPSAKDVKNLYAFLQAPKVTWIIEKSINIPKNILSKVRPTDRSLEIDSNQNKEKQFDIINELIAKLKAINE